MVNKLLTSGCRRSVSWDAGHLRHDCRLHLGAEEGAACFVEVSAIQALRPLCAVLDAVQPLYLTIDGNRGCYFFDVMLALAYCPRSGSRTADMLKFFLMIAHSTIAEAFLGLSNVRLSALLSPRSSVTTLNISPISILGIGSELRVLIGNTLSLLILPIGLIDAGDRQRFGRDII